VRGAWKLTLQMTPTQSYIWQAVDANGVALNSYIQVTHGGSIMEFVVGGVKCAELDSSGVLSVLGDVDLTQAAPGVEYEADSMDGVPSNNSIRLSAAGDAIQFYLLNNDGGLAGLRERVAELSADGLIIWGSSSTGALRDLITAVTLDEASGGIRDTGVEGESTGVVQFALQGVSVMEIGRDAAELAGSVISGVSL
jgi:hypothetical protein